MRSVPVAMAGMLLCGCGGQGGFATRFVDDYCDAYAYCDTSGRPCPVRLADGERAYSVCDYDRGLARECLDGPFTCNDEVDGFEVIEVPSACYDVCGVVQ